MLCSPFNWLTCFALWYCMHYSRKHFQSIVCHVLFFIAMVAIKRPNCKLYQGLPYLPKLSKKMQKSLYVCVYAALDVCLPHKLILLLVVGWLIKSNFDMRFFKTFWGDTWYFNNEIFEQIASKNVDVCPIGKAGGFTAIRSFGFFCGYVRREPKNIHLCCVLVVVSKDLKY